MLEGRHSRRALDPSDGRFVGGRLVVEDLDHDVARPQRRLLGGRATRSTQKMAMKDLGHAWHALCTGIRIRTRAFRVDGE